MRSRWLLVVTGVVCLVAGVAVAAQAMWRSSAEQHALAAARRVLEAPFLAAPRYVDLDAARAAELLHGRGGTEEPTDGARALRNFAEALLAAQRGELRLAADALETSVRLGGWTVPAHGLAADLARRERGFDRAREHTRRARALAADDPRVALVEADLALDEGRGADALAVLDGLQRRFAECAPLENRRGLAHELAGDPAAAEVAFRRAAAWAATQPEAWVNLGRVLQRAGKRAEALEAFAAAILRSPTDPEATLGRGLVLLSMGERSAARVAFDRSAELDPDYARPLVALGDLDRDAGNIDGAIERYRAATRVDPDEAIAWQRLGNLLSARHDASGAAQAFQEALRTSQAHDSK